MLKKMFLASIILLFISQFNYAQNQKKFSGFGIAFKYSNKYVLNSGVAKEGYKFVNLQRQGSNITIQLFPVVLTKSLRKIYLNAFEGELKSGGNALSATSQGESNFTINDPTTKGGNIKVKAILYQTNFTVSENKVLVKTKIFFFSYRKKGYVVAFSYLPALNHEKEFNLIKNSFTISK